jgi:hypothetical protein
MTVLAQTPGRVKTDETGRAGDKDRHAGAPMNGMLLLDNRACFMFLFPLMTFLMRCSVMKLVKQKYCSFGALD